MKDIYVRFGTTPNGTKIMGESRDVDHPASAGWFEVSSWQHMIRQPKSATASTAGGHTAERCEHGEMIFTKDIDSISPSLWQACSAGSLYDEVVIEFMRANGINGKRVKYLEIKLQKAIVASVSPSVEGEGLPTETFGLKYAVVSWKYNQQTFDGKFKPTPEVHWNLAKNDSSATKPTA
jgi:type VI secretion system secreted protein Hcp